jgi:hypothetical protein
MKPVAVGFGAGLGLAAVLAAVIVVLWSSIWPWLVVGIATAILAPSLLAAILACRGIVRAYGTAKPIQDSPGTPETVEHSYSVPSMSEASLRHAYNVSALQLATISRHKLGSYSSRSLFPYIQSNKREYWEHFRDEMIRLGFVVKDARRGFIWQGSYRRFATGLQWGQFAVSPHPKLPVPVILWIGAGFSTLSTANTAEAPDTVTISPGRIVYRG